MTQRLAATTEQNSRGFFGSVLGGDIIIDSLSVQFILSDVTAPYYLPGCPDAVIDSVQTYSRITPSNRFTYISIQNLYGTEAMDFNFSVCFGDDWRLVPVRH